MEDTLWDRRREKEDSCRGVLILILMEDTLWVMAQYIDKDALVGLNPYSNGICTS